MYHQVALQSALSLFQRYHYSLQSVQQWFDDAGALLEQVSLEPDLEKISDHLKDLEDTAGREHTVSLMIDEMQDLIPQMGDYMSPTVMKHILQHCEESRHKVTEVFEQLKQHRDNLQR